MSYIEASDTSLRKTGQIKLHGPGGFAGMRKAGGEIRGQLETSTVVSTGSAPPRMRISRTG